MTTTITINSDTQNIIEILQTSLSPIVDVVQVTPPRVTVIGLPGSLGPQGPQGDPGPPGPQGNPGVDLDATTKQVILPIYGGYGPVTDHAVQERVTSSGGPTENAPFVEYYQLAFDPNTDQTWFWGFTLPIDYLSGGTLRLTWATKGTDVNPVVWKGAAAIGVIGTTDADAAVFDTVITGTDTPSTTEGIITQTTIALTMANAEANTTIIVMVGRDADNINDTNTSVAVLVEAMFDFERA